MELLRIAKKNVQIVLFSDNLAGRVKLTSTMVKDFLQEEPEISLELKTIGEKVHDRYIVIDYGTAHEALYHCGASSKDAGNKITTSMKVDKPELYHSMLEELLNNSDLILK